MVAINFQSADIARLTSQLANDTGFQDRTTVDLDFRAEIDEFEFISQFIPWNVTSIQATGWTQERVYDGVTFQLVVSGSGIGPVSSLEAFEAAVNAGFAQGQFDQVSLLRNGLEIVSLDLGTSGYLLSSGNQSLRLDGATVNSLDDLYDVMDLFDQADVDNLMALPPVERRVIFDELAGIGVTGLSFRDDGDVIFALSVDPTGLKIELGGYALRLDGTFPNDFGDLAELAFTAHQAFVNEGLPTALTLLAEIAPSAITFSGPGEDALFSGPDGETLFTATLSNLGNTDETVFIVDGVIVPEDRFFVGLLEDGIEVDLPNDPFGQPNDPAFVAGSLGDDLVIASRGNATIFGFDGSDTLVGGNGDDYINPGTAPYPNGDLIYGSAGNDTIDFSSLGIGGGFISVVYDFLPNAITANINQVANTGTVIKAGLGTDTLIDVAAATNSDITDGLDIWGTDAADSYTIVTAANSWIALHGGIGADSYNLTLNAGGTVRLDFAGGWSGGATQGAVVNATMGVIANDGFGFGETLALTRNGGLNASSLQIQGTDFADRLTGSAGRDVFLPRGGNDTIDGGTGFDMIRFDRNQMTSGATVDLDAGTATGFWQGMAFAHSLASIEDVRGSQFDDMIRGSAMSERLDGRGGDDVLISAGGNDTLIGGSGADRFVLTGTGNVTIADFQIGTDTLDLRQGSLDAAAVTAAFAAATEMGGHTTVNLGAAGSVVLNGLTKAQALQIAPLPPVPTTPVLAELFGGANFLEFAFFNTLTNGINLDEQSWTSTQIVYRNPSNGAVTTFTGTGFPAASGQGNPPGIVTGWQTVDAGGAVVTRLSGLNWPLAETFGAITDALLNNDDSRLIALFDLQPLTVDASAATAAVELRADELTNSVFFTGSAFADTLEGGDGNDLIRGAGGNDVIYGGMGNDDLAGGVGNDLIFGGAGANILWGGAGNDSVQGGTGNDTIYGGGNGTNRLFGNDGDDLIFAGAGGDLIGGGAGNDTIRGGDGADTIYGGFGDDNLAGGAGNDQIFGAAGNNIIWGGQGADTVQGGDGADTIYGGGNGTNRLFGNDGDDLIYGGAGGDLIGGGAGNDQIFGLSGANIIWGGFGDDTVQGGTGNDTIYGGGDGTNALFGNDGDDLIFAGIGGDFIGGGAGNDTVRGSEGNDTIYGGLGNDDLAGGAGDDVIFGATGANTLWGGLGNDSIHAGTGRDGMNGGPGADTFVFASAAHIGIGAARDVITDFTSGVDKIDLSALNTQFNGTSGVLGGGKASFFYFAAGGLLIGDQNGNGAADWVLELTGAPGVTAGDFLL